MTKTVNLILIMLLFMLSCKKETADKNPSLKVDYELVGLTLRLTIKALDTDGKVQLINIDWGDTKTENLYPGSDGLVEQQHYYSQPLQTEVTIKAIDNDGYITEKTLQLNPDFEPTSFEGIKQSLYKTSADEFLVLTINLHNYQEKFQNEKFNTLTDVINKMNIDFVLMQECAQHRNSPVHNGIIRTDNMALILSNILKQKYNTTYTFIWDWSHYGWDVWEEGDAILSKHTILDNDSRYVSTNTQTSGILSRKAIYGSYLLPSGDSVNLFSTHIHWRLSETDQEQNTQVSNLKTMVLEKEQLSSNPGILSIVGGDFNGTPTSEYPWSEGYNTMVADNTFIDCFLQAYPDANSKPAQSIYNTGGDITGRIDYIFMKNHPNLEIIDSQIIFTSQIVGTISDHYGVITKFRLKSGKN